jgi:hypothetical protein
MSERHLFLVEEAVAVRSRTAVMAGTAALTSGSNVPSRAKTPQMAHI